MKKFLGLLGTALLAFSAPCDLSAQGMKWRTVYEETFGGDNPNDDIYGPELDKDLVGSSLIYSDMPFVGTYCLVKTSNDNSDWHPGSDHTHKGDKDRGYYMRLDPSNGRGDVTVYRQKLTGICEGVNFSFSAWIANLSYTESSSTTKIAVGIFEDKDAQNLVSDGAYFRKEITSYPSRSDENLNWEDINIDFKVGPGISEAYFIVTVFDPEPGGYDIAIDDIKIDVEQPIIKIDDEKTKYIKGEPVNLSASFANNGFFSDLSVVQYKWQYSKDGVTYSDIAGGSGYYSKGCTYTIPSFDKDVNNGFYRVIIGESGTLDKPICSIQEDFAINETKNRLNVVICKGETREVMGTMVTDRMDGMEVAAGSDYKLLVNVVKPEIIEKADTFFCIGTVIDGVTYDKATSFAKNDTIKSIAAGCDSIIYTQKYVITDQTKKELPDVHICQGETYKTKEYKEEGEFQEVKTDGCIAYWEKVYVHPTYNIDKTFPLCFGSELNGEVYTQDAKKTFKYKTATYGCDSIINATIEVKDKIVEELEPVELCEGSDVYEFGGKVYGKAGKYDLEYKTKSVLSGCDSTAKVHLTIHPRYNNMHDPIDTMICYDSKLFGVVYPEPTTAPILVRDPTTYTTVNGCDSIVYYNVEVLKIQLKLAIASDKNTVCKGEEVEIIVKDLKPSNTPLSWTPDLGGASANRKNFTPSEDMVCVVKARNDIAQCETTDTARVYVKESPVIEIDTFDTKNNIVNYTVTSGTEPFHIYLNKSEISSEPFGEVKNSPIGVHKLWVRDSSDCTSQVTYEVKPVPITPGGFISPNGDGINDKWTIENIDVYPKSRVRIFNRDGRVIADYKPYVNEEGFDGTYQGKPLPSTDYWYEIDLFESDQQYVGHFTLIR